MKRKHVCIFFIAIFILLLPTQSQALSINKTETDGTEYKVTVNFKNTYVNHSIFELSIELEAVSFGTLEGVIVGFYDIQVDISLSGDNSYLLTDNTTLANINSIGGSSNTILSYNLSGITSETFMVSTMFNFEGNNTQGEDPSYGFLWIVGMVRVKEASLSIILPILAVVGLAYIANKKWKK